MLIRAVAVMAVVAALLAAWHFRGTQSPAVTLPPGCSVFPADNIWNTPVRNLPVDARSAEYVKTMGASQPLHPDFSAGWRGAYGMPYNVADANTPQVDIAFTSGADAGPYRFPPNVKIEGGDGHAIVIDPGRCFLYETFLTKQLSPRKFQADTGAVYDLRSNHLRIGGFSVDAAGLPIFPGLVRYQEVESGRIAHAVRFTTTLTRANYVWPATHQASYSHDPARPPMGQRFRLRAAFDIRGFSRDTQVILKGLQDYGMILADNGGNWYVTGTLDSRWKRSTIAEMARVKGADFEAVDVSSLMVDAGSASAGRNPLR